MSTNTIDNETNILLNDSIQAPKNVQKSTREPRKPRNLPYDKVIQLVENSAPVLEEAQAPPKKRPLTN